MALTLSDAAAHARLNALTALLNGGTIEVRTGAKPATVGAAATGTLLGTLGLSATAFANASGRAAVANAISSDTSADASGTAGWFRAKASGSAAVIDGTITTSGNGGDLIIDNASIVAGGQINATSWTVSE